MTYGPQKPVKSKAKAVLSFLIGDGNLNKANVQLRQSVVELLQIQNVVKVALTSDCHYWKPRFPECRYITVSFQAASRKFYRRRRSSTSAKESFPDTSQHTITPSKGGARFGHAS